MNRNNVFFVTGVMGSGKSKKLIEDYCIYSNEFKRPLVLTLSFSEKNFNKTFVSSRNKTSVTAISISIKEQNKITLEQLLNLFNGHKIILIDESQFLSKELLSLLMSIALKGSTIGFYGLSHTFTGELFEASEILLDSLEKPYITTIEATCEIPECLNKAQWNARYIGNSIVRTGETLLESKSTYKALCDFHFKEI